VEEESLESGRASDKRVQRSGALFYARVLVCVAREVNLSVGVEVKNEH
jgi:hypothetical protein